MHEDTAPIWSELKDEAIDLLTELLTVTAQTKALINGDKAYQRMEEAIRSRRDDLRVFELRMAIIAPMKAGKSTILNAIIGQDLLPARDTATTVIPTEIVSDPTKQQPTLQIPAETAERFSELWSRLHQRIATISLAKAKEQTSKYPELSTLIEAIFYSKKPVLELNTVSADEIKKQLFLLNDLCRVSFLLEPEDSRTHLELELELPRIETPFYGISAANNDAGKIVFVDSPGPNEANYSRILNQIIDRQMQRASLLLLILDYTQMHAEAAVQIARKVHDVVDLAGEDNLFILVNKIDARKEGDEKGLSPDGVRQFIVSHLQLSKAAADNHVFEISAERAFVARRFLQELQRIEAEPGAAEDTEQLNQRVRRLPSAPALAQLVLSSTDWKDDLEEASAQKLKRRAEGLWQKSGFPSFLMRAIETVMQQVAPRTLSEALGVGQRPLFRVVEDLQLFKRALITDTEKLRQQIQSLDEEMRLLEQRYQKFRSQVEGARTKLRAEVADAKKKFKDWPGFRLDEYFDQPGRSNPTLLDRLDEGLRKILSPILGPQIEKKAPAIQFTTAAVADAFARQAVQFALERSRPEIQRMVEQVHQRVERICRDFELEVASQVGPLFTKAADRMKKDFDVPLSMPKLKLGDPFSNSFDTQALKRHVPASSEVRHRYERHWYTLWLYEHEVRYVVPKGEGYIVSLESVAKSVDNMIRSNLDATLANLNHYLESQFGQIIDEYFTRLQQYFLGSRENLKKAQAVRSMDLEQRKEADAQASNLLARATAWGMQATSLQRRIRMSKDRDAGLTLLNIVTVYALPDSASFSEFERHLATLLSAGVVQSWHAGMLRPGTMVREETAAQIERAHVIVVLLSQDFLVSPDCMEQLEWSIQRQRVGMVHIIPVLLSPCDWRHTRLATQKVLPSDGSHIHGLSAVRREAFFADVAMEVRKCLSDSSPGESKR